MKNNSGVIARCSCRVYSASFVCPVAISLLRLLRIGLLRFTRNDKKGQSMTEYLLVVFLISYVVFDMVRLFGDALNTAFRLAIINIAINIR